MESFQRFTEMEDKVKQLENELKWAIIVEMEAVRHVTILLIPICLWETVCAKSVIFPYIYINYHATLSDRFSPQLRPTLIKRETGSVGTKEEQKRHKYVVLYYKVVHDC